MFKLFCVYLFIDVFLSITFFPASSLQPTKRPQKDPPKHSTIETGYDLATNTSNTPPTPVLKTSTNIISTMGKTSTMATTYSSTIGETMKTSNPSGMIYHCSFRLIKVVGSLIHMPYFMMNLLPIFSREGYGR